jgi:hypothetical protein
MAFQCPIDINDEIADVSIVVDELNVNIKRVRDLIRDINNATDCETIKLKLKLTGDELDELLDDLKEEAKEIAKKFLPGVKLPKPTPTSILGWVKKNVLGNIIPQINAYIKILQTASELVGAISELAQTARNVLPKLEQCALTLIDEQLVNAGVPLSAEQLLTIRQGSVLILAESIIQVELDKFTTEISDEIAKALCNTGLAADLVAITDAIQATRDFILEVDSLQDSVDQAITATLQDLGAAGNDIAEATGVPFTVNTTDIDSFKTSIENGAMDATNAAAVALLAKAPPENTVLPAITGSTVVGSTLTVSNGTWAGEDLIYDYLWYRGDDPVWSQTTNTYVLTDADLGATIKCQVQVQNEVGAQTVVSESTAVITSNPPVPSVNPAISGSANVGQVLTVSSGTWSGTPTITYQWQWAHISANIYGANTNSYTIVAEDLNRSLTCIVTATSNSGIAQYRVTPTAPVTGTLAITGDITATGNVSAVYVNATEDVYGNTDGTVVRLVTHYHANNNSSPPYGYPTSP